jgi:threonine synthase
MKYKKGLKCRECGRQYSIAPNHVCEFCFGPLEVVYRSNTIREDLTREKIELRPKTTTPSHFRDRVVSVALSKSKEFGFRIVACASTGNLANSVAALAAARGLESYIFVPYDLEPVERDVIE